MIRLCDIKIVKGGMGGWVDPRPEQLTTFILIVKN